MRCRSIHRNNGSIDAHIQLVSFIFHACFQCPEQKIKSIDRRILLFRYEPNSHSTIIPLHPKDILLPDTIVEVIISRKLT